MNNSCSSTEEWQDRDIETDEVRTEDALFEVFTELCNVWLDTKGPILMKRYLQDQRRKELIEEKEGKYKKEVIDLTKNSVISKKRQI